MRTAWSDGDGAHAVVAPVSLIVSAFAPVADALTTSSNLLFALDQFLATAQSVDTLLWLLYVSLAITGLIDLSGAYATGATLVGSVTGAP